MNDQKALKVSYRVKEWQGNSSPKHSIQCQSPTKQKLLFFQCLESNLRLLARMPAKCSTPTLFTPIRKSHVCKMYCLVRVSREMWQVQGVH